jgi:hypothetical protein
MGQRICSILDCGEPHCARGWCRHHYRLWKDHGDPLVKTRKNMTVEERFWSKVDKTEGCWLWRRGYVNAKGYGYFSVSMTKCVQVHRFAYELLVGPIPDGLTIDHVKSNGCTSKACVKAVADEYGPAHLEPVTNRENILRGDTFQGRNARKTHCLKGHAFDELNTYVDRDGHRHCRTCGRDFQRERQRRLRAERNAIVRPNLLGAGQRSV